MNKIFIDGSAGTTGLRIRDRLRPRRDIELLTLPEHLRKDPEARKEILNRSDAVFLCLPDAAAVEAVSMIENSQVTVFDTSTAHRTDPDFVYGMPELSSEQKEAIRTSRRIAVPGCHASGFIALIAPLIRAKVLSEEAKLCCFSLTGYSGGGKKMIAEYEAEERDPLFDAPRQYALGQNHKHLKEMTAITGLKNAPAFCPIVADFYSGMEVTVPLFRDDLKTDPAGLTDLYREIYRDGMIFVRQDSEEGFLSAAGMTGKDTMQISVHGNEERILLTARYDNLGKGASGAAIQCMNLKFSIPEDTGLER